MTLIESLRALVNERAQLAARVSAIDAELAAVRAELDIPTPAVGWTPSTGVVALPPAPEVQPERRQRERRAEAVCKGCGKTFVPKAGSAGVYCSRECFCNPDRPNRTRNASVPPLRAKHILKPAIPERRCVNRRCLKKFKPMNDGQIFCEKCHDEKGSEPPAKSWHAKATSKPSDEFEVVKSGRDFESADGLGSTLSGGEYRKL